jgi:hypothetical protein
MNEKRENFYLANKFKFEVERVMGIDLSDKTRIMEYQMSRMAFCYIVRNELPKCSYGELGILLNRDHATMMHSYKQARSLMQTNDKTFEKYYSDIRICFDNVRNSISESTLVELEGLKMHNILKEYLHSSNLTEAQKNRSLKILISRIN